MILEKGRRYQLRKDKATYNKAGQIVVEIAMYVDGFISFHAINHPDYYKSTPAEFCMYFEPNTFMPMKFIYKRRTSTFKPR